MLLFLLCCFFFIFFIFNGPFRDESQDVSEIYQIFSSGGPIDADEQIDPFYSQSILGPNWRNWYISLSFISVAFQNGLDDCNGDVRRLNCIDNSTSGRNLESFRRVTPEFKSKNVYSRCQAVLGFVLLCLLSRAEYMVGIAM